jgi:zinc protease
MSPPIRSTRRKGSGAGARLLRGGCQIQEHVLANGLRVLIAERHADPVVASLLLYRCGARNEREQEAGVSHFLEHMMFKGSARFGKGAVDRLTAELGGQNNAFTSYDHTGYWFEFAADRWEHALDVEADRMRTLVLDPAEFGAEREVVLEELAMGEDDPWRQLARRVEQILFPRHPYGRPIIGFPDTLRALTPEAMREYYGRFYHPGNATLVVCGAVEPERALEAVRGRFAPIPAGRAQAEIDCFRGAIEEPSGEARLTMRWDDQARRLCLAWPAARVGTEQDFALDLLLAILTSGRTSRLQRRLVLDRRLATSVSGSNDSRMDAGCFWLYAECARGVEPEKLERAVDRELEAIASDGPTSAELVRAKALLLASEAYDAETVSDVAEEIGTYAVDADWRLAFDGGERHASVSARAVREAAAAILPRRRRVVGWCMPKDEGAPGRKGSRSRRSVRAAVRRDAQRAGTRSLASARRRKGSAR